MNPKNPKKCCERDHDNDGNCDRHPAKLERRKRAPARLITLELMEAEADACLHLVNTGGGPEPLVSACVKIARAWVTQAAPRQEPPADWLEAHGVQTSAPHLEEGPR